MDAEARARLKERAVEELKLFWMLAVYLWLFLGSFTIYRRLVLAEAGIAYLHYGFALVEALVIAKVILIGNLFGFSRRFDDRPLVVPILFKTLFFGGIVLLFGVLEHLVEGWFRHEGLFGGLHALRDLGGDEVGARILMLMSALLPLSAFCEIRRVIGPDKLAAILFSGREKTDGELRRD